MEIIPTHDGHSTEVLVFSREPEFLAAVSPSLSPFPFRLSREVRHPEAAIQRLKPRVAILDFAFPASHGTRVMRHLLFSGALEFTQSITVVATSLRWEARIADRIVPFTQALRVLPGAIHKLLEAAHNAGPSTSHLPESALAEFAALMDASFTKREGCEQYAAWRVLWPWYLARPRAPCPLELLYSAVREAGVGWLPDLRPELRQPFLQVIKNLKLRLATVGQPHGYTAILRYSRRGVSLIFLPP
ncbi:MAG: hypothetical protein ACREJQ_05395 [bacterium]